MGLSSHNVPIEYVRDCEKQEPGWICWDKKADLYVFVQMTRRSEPLRVVAVRWPALGTLTLERYPYAGCELSDYSIYNAMFRKVPDRDKHRDGIILCLPIEKVRTLNCADYAVFHKVGSAWQEEQNNDTSC